MKTILFIIFLIFLTSCSQISQKDKEIIQKNAIAELDFDKKYKIENILEENNLSSISQILYPKIETAATEQHLMVRDGEILYAAYGDKAPKPLCSIRYEDFIKIFDGLDFYGLKDKKKYYKEISNKNGIYFEYYSFINYFLVGNTIIYFSGNVIINGNIYYAYHKENDYRYKEKIDDLYDKCT